ncbi:hypothetical protein FQR65_LT19796 [Abscondita terminalis]|nr:hypothetical protein FQR65_LT19796 [Abscondita terminalis]
MEEKLILIVQSYKELYDPSDGNYHNQTRRQNVWEEIGENMKLTGEECRKRWTQIRDNYRKALKSRTTKSGQAANKTNQFGLLKNLNSCPPEPVQDSTDGSINIDDVQSNVSETHHFSNVHHLLGKPLNEQVILSVSVNGVSFFQKS